jgi:hypothetical protein
MGRVLSRNVVMGFDAYLQKQQTEKSSASPIFSKTI